VKRPGFVARLLHTWRRFGAVRSEWGPEAALAPRSPKVSVMVVTYNHERYIGQALEGILMQERDFDIEINVIDDASTDGTQRVVREYQRRYPDIIHCHFNERNVGHIATQLNTYRGYQTLRGQYYALLEGDDYWSDSRKLKTQVEFLDRHPEYVACAHDTLKVYDDGRKPPEHFLPFKAFGRNTATIGDLVGLAGVFHLSSIVYRNVFGTHPPLCLSDPYSCEATINMVYGQFGDFRYLPGYMSVYRVHGSGVFSGQSLERMWLFHLHGFRRFALYMGRRHLYWFVRATAGFAAYVLGARRRGEVPALHWRTRVLFAVHLVVARALFLVLHPLHRLNQDTVELRRDLRHLMRVLVGRADPPDAAAHGLLANWVETRRLLRRTRRLLTSRSRTDALPAAQPGPKVSVIVLAHDQSASISRALSSVLAQETDFAFEVNVVDNASRDGTREIVLDWERRHPGQVRCFLRAPGERPSDWQLHTYRGLRTARGQYVALLDAGDYWSHPRKLAEQVRLLDAHPAFAGCGHEIFDARKPSGPVHVPLVRSAPGEPAGAGVVELLAQSVHFGLSTVMYRNLFGTFPPPCVADPYCNEGTLHALYGQFGPFYGIPRPMAVRAPAPAPAAPVDVLPTMKAASTRPAAARAAPETVRETPAAMPLPPAPPVPRGPNQRELWCFQLRGFQRSVLYFGVRQLPAVAQAMEGFCQRVLERVADGETWMPPRMLLQFRLNYLAARSVRRSVDTAHRIRRMPAKVRRYPARVHGTLQSAHAAINAPTVRGRLYKMLVLLSPHWLLRTVLRMESRWPVLHGLRRIWKHSGGIPTDQQGLT
jgi:glycosyltransferase involved in cell wall biosynthesis